MLKVSKEANPNYVCKIVQLKGLKKHSNADRLQIVDVDFQNVVTGLDAKEGDIYVYFPVESKINYDFLSHTNSFRDKTKNLDNKKSGFFEDHCRVKALRLRGEKSMGYIVPIRDVYSWAYKHPDVVTDPVGTTFDTINNIKLVEKYVIPVKESHIKQGKKPKISRLIDGQVHLHVDTENLRTNAHKIKPNDLISITYKTHGTSWFVSNVLVKKKLNWKERLAKWAGFEVVETEYDLIYGSRGVIKNDYLDDPKKKDHFYGYDLWKDIKEEIGKNIPKGYSLYGEMLGFNANGKFIQNAYDYGCKVGEHRLEVYRITYTNPDGLVTELSYPQIKEFCDKIGLKASHLFYHGIAKEWLHDNTYLDESYCETKDDWEETLVKTLELRYNDKYCFMCEHKVPEEGVVVRKELLFSCESYKLKSFSFLEKESQDLDNSKEVTNN